MRERPALTTETGEKNSRLTGEGGKALAVVRLTGPLIKGISTSPQSVRGSLNCVTGSGRVDPSASPQVPMRLACRDGSAAIQRHGQQDDRINLSHTAARAKQRFGSLFFMVAKG